jgi:hypothetical protein
MMQCLKQRDCVQAGDGKLELFNDLSEALEVIKSHKSIIRDQNECISSVAMMTELDRCVKLAEPRPSSSTSSISTTDINAVMCSAAHDAYTCLLYQTVCSSNGGGGKPRSSTVGQLIGKFFRVSTKSTLRRSYNCVIVDDGTDAISGVPGRGRGVNWDVILLIFLSTIGAATSETFVN